MTASDLTPAERHILELMASGLQLKQIAGVRGTSWGCVKQQANRLRLKTGVRTLFQLGAWAERHGIREMGAQT